MTPPTSSPSATDTARAPLRRDAERNRRRILDAAAHLIVEHGLAVPLEDIALEAGVGIGTLYRRFADRDTLLRALFEDHVEAVVALAQQALAIDQDGDGVERFLTATAEHHGAERGLSQLLRTGPLGGELARYASRRITPLAERLLARAHAAGTLARTIGPGDLVLVELMVSAVQHAAVQDPEGPTDDTSWRRALALALAGLRARPAPEGAAPDTTTIDRLQRRPRG